MESPLSYSTHSEAPVLSEDSGLIITSGSFSSDSASGWQQITSETQESDCDERSLSLCDSAGGSEHMCGENFNTVKKGPGKILTTPIEPPLEFQDSPILTRKLLDAGKKHCSVEVPPEHTHSDEACSVRTDFSLYGRSFRCEHIYEKQQRYSSPKQILHLSPCHTARPVSRSSLSSRLSSSHNSITTQLQVDDSSYITQAISHDTLSANTSDIADMYNVPFDSDIYAVPVDTIKPSQGGRYKGKKLPKPHRKRERSACQATSTPFAPNRHNHNSRPCGRITEAAQESVLKRYSLPGTSGSKACSMQILKEETSHMSINEVRQYLHVLCTSSTDSLDNREDISIDMLRYLGSNNNNSIKAIENTDTNIKSSFETNNNINNGSNRKHFSLNLMVKKNKEHQSKELLVNEPLKKTEPKKNKLKNSPVKNISFNIRQTFCNLFRSKRRLPGGITNCEQIAQRMASTAPPMPFFRRALPPLPQTPPFKPRVNDDGVIDFATSIEKVKDYGWYWGPISVDVAEKILSTEPDGSFIVRDSSDDHYIFTLTFKLNGMRHVRIEHEQGNFCFGGCAMFKAHTIVDFIENAVETSRSGRYLFFLNLRPVLGPVRVQLLYPVSRFKRVQSLQHMCRFVILKVVRRDLINSLPLPRRMLDYLNSTHYYAELLADS